jgi:hypothetical protein
MFIKEQITVVKMKVNQTKIHKVHVVDIDDKTLEDR